MTALDRKLLRDLWHMRGQATAICLVLACGVSTFVMSLTVVQSLEESRAVYYERYRFADVFTSLKRAPNSLAERIAEIPGVAKVQTRVVRDVTLDVEGLAEPAIGRLISVPDRGQPALNDLHLRSGRYLEPERSGEVLVGEAFAVAHKLKPGDTVRAVINERRKDLRIVGIVLSPEYIYQIRPGDVMPDDKRFGVFWMGYRELASAFNMEGAFNDVALSLMPGASEAEVILRLDRLTEPYGGLGAYGRYDQTSNRYISDELRQLRGMGLVPPLIFLGVAGFLLNVVLTRLISTQREQIAALKAFGYSKWEVGRHYLKLVLLIVVLGVAGGSALGAWLAEGLTELYAKFFRFPHFVFALDARVIVAALAVSALAAGAGTFTAVRRAANLPPAEAMRPEPPASYKPSLIERLGLKRFLPQTMRMIFRNLERHPLRSLFSVLGIAAAASTLVLGNYVVDAVDVLIEFDFYTVQRQDVTVTFVEPTSAGALYELQHYPGVLHAEPFRAVPVRLRFGHRSHRLAILGIRPGATLRRLLTPDAREVDLPPHGLVISDNLASLLHVRPGERLTVEVLEGERPTRQVVVAGEVAGYIGTAAYMDLDALNALMREGEAYSGAYLEVDHRQMGRLYRELKETPRVAGVNVKEAMLKSFEETIAENLMRFRLFNVGFASVIACGVVYNAARISLSERSRELASLRVLGFTRGEISFILLGELAVITLAAIPPGLAMGYGFAALSAYSLQTETNRIPLVVSSATFGLAATVVLVASVISGLLVRRKLDHLDLVAVLKSRE
jgi:putative ABC transport system permease protein